MPLPSFLRYTKTATDDTVFLVADIDQWLEYADIFVYAQDAYLGDVGAQDIEILAGDSYNIPHPVKVSDLYFKNVTPGANTRIVIAGTPYRRQK